MRHIADVLERQAVDLAHLQDRTARRVLRALEDARRQLLAELGSQSLPASVHQLHVMLAQVENAILELQDRMGLALSEGERASHEAALQNLVALVKRGDRTFRGHGAELDMRTLARLSAERGLALHRYSVRRYGLQLIEAIQRELVSGYAQGLTVYQMTRRIAGPGGVLQGHRSRAELIVRMELVRAYDVGAQASLEEMAAFDEPDTADPLLKRADEHFDHRNHPFSRLLHGQAVLPRQEWEVPVTGEARRGLVWQVTNGIAHGFSYPAHFNERGRQVPWRASWGGEAYRPAQSFRTRNLTKSDLRALRALAQDREPRSLSSVGRKRLELSGFLDSQGRVTPAGKKAAFNQQENFHAAR